MKWKIDENYLLPLAVIEDTEDGMGVAEISGVNWHNARLIAAAPTMRETLKAVHELTLIDADTLELALEALSNIRAETHAVLSNL